MIHHVTPISVLPLLPLLDQKLTGMLRVLSAEDWQRSVMANNYSIKDIAALLLKRNLTVLSLHRDKYNAANKPTSSSLPQYRTVTQHQNETWMEATRELSPEILIELLELTSNQFNLLMHELDPWDDALTAVNWEGEEINKNWFFAAREYAVRWLHQQWMRDALSLEGLLNREFFYPFFDTLMCGLPQTYKDKDAVVGSSVLIKVSGEAGGDWHVNKTEEGWVLRHTTRVEPLAVLTTNPENAWRVFTNRMSTEESADGVTISGATELGKVAFGLADCCIGW